MKDKTPRVGERVVRKSTYYRHIVGTVISTHEHCDKLLVEWEAGKFKKTWVNPKSIELYYHRNKLQS